MVQRLPPLHALRTFEAVARLGSVTAAADDLCVTHSAVSHQIRQFEEWFGIRLVERNGRGIVVTSAGGLYRSSVCEAFARLAEGTRLLERTGDRSSVRIGALPMFLTSWQQPRMRASLVPVPGDRRHNHLQAADNAVRSSRDQSDCAIWAARLLAGL